MNFKNWEIEVSFTLNVSFENVKEEEIVRSEIKDRLTELIFKCDYMPIIGTFIDSSYNGDLIGGGLVLDQIAFHGDKKIMFWFIEATN